MAAKTENSPSPRSRAFLNSTTDRLYLWGGHGGKTEPKPNTVHIYSINTETWMSEFTKGPHPHAGLRDGGCSLAGQHIYLYGGYDGSSRSGSLYQLNTDNWSWSELSKCSAGGPGRMSGCRMITYKDQLVVVGGYYGRITEPDSKQPRSRYDYGYTNELHCYSLTTGSWSSPSVKGSRPPPCSFFSLTMIDEEDAVMFGGFSGDLGYSAGLYVLHLPTMSWTCGPSKGGDRRPEGRRDHIAVCLGYGGQYKKVLVSGGWSGGPVLSDTWLLDQQSWTWEEVQVSYKKLLQRHGHSAAPLAISPECVEVFLFGGKQEIMGSSFADTTALRFELQGTRSSDKRSWILTDIADHTQLGSLKRLNDKRRMMESFSKVNNGSADRSVRRLQQQLEEMEMRARDSNNRAISLERRVSELNTTLKEADRRAEESDRRAEELQRRARESDRRAEELQRRVEELQRRVEESEDNDIGGIVTHLVPCAAKWKLIGTALRIPQGILTNIEVKPSNMAGAPCSYLIETLTYWTNNTSGSTKTALVRALRNEIVNEGRIAQELEQASF